MVGKKALALFAVSAAMLAAQGAQAVDIDVSGFVRQEAAVKVTGNENRNNEQENKFHGNDKSNALDLFATRLEAEARVKFNEEFRARIQMRAFGDYGFYRDSSGRDFFGSAPFGGDRGNRLETTGDNYVVDFPSLYLDYNHGPVWLRLGNQQIAWGEALFFRVLDVPNGLDLRRHFILDPAAEEYSDKRVSSPGLRGSVRLLDQYEIEGFTQMFSPSILPGPGTPFNFIPDQFTVQTSDAANRKWNFGGRVQARFFDSLSVQAIAVRRANPDGVFRWTEAKGTGALAGTPFQMNSTGVGSSAEWFRYAATARLDGVNGVCTALSLAAGCFGSGPAAFAAATATLDGTFGALGPLRGHIERVFKRENIYGVGANYIFDGAPDTLFDQLVMRAEVSYTPDKVFTSPDLGRNFLKKDEWSGSLVFEKYHRFTQSRDWPATFIVAEYMFKSQSDLFGRYLGGNGASDAHAPSGVGNFHAFVLAVQQPFPNLIWRGDLAVLYDTEGGVFVQPGVKWRPSSTWTVDLFANLEFAKQNNRNIIQTFDHAQEVSLRVAYQF